MCIRDRSIACEPVLKKHAKGFLGNVIDMLVIFGIVGSISTSLGIGAPVLSVIIREVFGIPQNYDFVVQMCIRDSVWIVSFTIFCGYGFYTSISYFNPYLTEVIGVSPESSGFISIVRNYLLLLLAPVGGIIADKVFKSTCKWLSTDVYKRQMWGLCRM